ncbi:MAG: putative lipid II flippase FtsW [Pontibacterium sp.]
MITNVFSREALSNLASPSTQTMRPFDPWLLLATGSLLCIGLVMISSASMDVALNDYGNAYFFMVRHTIYVLLGCSLALFVWFIPLSFWQRTGPHWLGFAFILLLLVLVPGIGKEVKGSSRWIALGPINLQASEVAKFAMVVYVAGYLVRRLEEVRTTWAGVAKPALPLAVFLVLLLLEPDFGASVVMVSAVMAMVFLGGMRMSQFILCVSGVFSALFVILRLESYRMDRLKAFLDPWKDPFGDGYQVVQAQIAFGRGDIFGVGLGNSIQKLFYLPEAHTDFVLSVLAEEFGLMGVSIVVALYLVLILRTFMIGRRAEKIGSFFTAYMCYGIATLLATQTLINIGVNAGALPTKGLTLPFISYGGSSMLMCCVMVAVVLRADYETKRKQALLVPQKTSRQTDLPVNKGGK